MEIYLELLNVFDELRNLYIEGIFLKAYIMSCTERLFCMENRINAMEAVTADCIRAVNAFYNNQCASALAQLQLDLNDRNQDLLGNDLVMFGVPEDNGEDIAQKVIACAEMLRVKLEETDLVTVERSDYIRTTDGQGEKELQPRSIIVRFVRREVRGLMMSAARFSHSIIPEEIMPIRWPQRFYVSERLTRTNRILLNKAYETGRQLSWRYVWSEDGKIYACRAQGERILRIRSEHDFPFVFGEGYIRLTEQQ